MPQLTPIYLFSKEQPKGEMFKFPGGKDSDEFKQKLAEGWVTTPAMLDLPEENKTGVKLEDAKDAHPEDLKKLIESYGFIVMTPEQLKAEANKMADMALDIENFADEEIIKEAERRGLKDSGEGDNDLMQELLSQFDDDPESLTKDELVTLGNAQFRLGLRSNMKEATLIEKINEAMNEE